jgi:hypothetical protein
MWSSATTAQMSSWRGVQLGIGKHAPSNAVTATVTVPYISLLDVSTSHVLRFVDRTASGLSFPTD